MLEVEFKASLGERSLESVRERAQELGFLPAFSLRESDSYYNGSDRDFRRTDEALRLRSCQTLPDGPSVTLMTYKGAKLDKTSSTRREYEFEVSDARAAHNLLSALGYSLAFRVEKERREFRRGSVTLCLDEVRGLGRFLELETLVEREELREASEEKLLGLLDALRVGRSCLTRKSYLELLAEK